MAGRNIRPLSCTCRHASSPASRPRVTKARSSASFQGSAQLRRMQFRYFCFGENNGPGAIEILRASARRCSSKASTFYQFTVYALKTDKLPLDENAPAAMVGFYLHQNLIKKAALKAQYGR